MTEKKWVDPIYSRYRLNEGTEVVARLLSRINKNTETGCWEWKRPLAKKVRPAFNIFGKKHVGARAVYLMFNGDLTERKA